MKLLTTRELFITLTCLVVMSPFCLVYYFSVCGEVGCGGRPVLLNMNIFIWLVVILVNILFAPRKSKHENPPSKVQDVPPVNVSGMLVALLAVVTVLCGLMLRAILREWYCLDELCSNLEDGGRMITIAAVLTTSILMVLIAWLAANRKNQPLANAPKQTPTLTKKSHQIPPFAGQDTPKMNVYGLLVSSLGVLIAAFCGLTLRMILHKWYCLDEICSNLEDGGRKIDTVTVVVIFSVVLLIWGVAEKRRNRH